MKCYAVIDTNVVVSAFISVMKKSNLDESVPYKVLSLVLNGKNKITPIFNDEILDEYKEVLSRAEFKLSKSIIRRFLNDIRDVGETIEAAKIDEIVSDPKDVVFYRVVMGGKETQDSYLAAGDKKHFPIHEFVVSPSEFIEIGEKNK